MVDFLFELFFGYLSRLSENPSKSAIVEGAGYFKAKYLVDFSINLLLGTLSNA